MFRNIGKFVSILKNHPRKIKWTFGISVGSMIAYGIYDDHNQDTLQYLSRHYTTMNSKNVEEEYFALTKKRKNLFYEYHDWNDITSVKMWKDTFKNHGITEKNNKKELVYLMPKAAREVHKLNMIKKIKKHRDLYALAGYSVSGEDLLDIIDQSEVYVKFHKDLPKKLKSNGYTYSKGINKDSKPFNPFCTECEDNFYFTSIMSDPDVSHFKRTAFANIINSPNVYYRIEKDKIKGSAIELSF